MKDLFANGRLRAAPDSSESFPPAPKGIHQLELERERDGYYYVPVTYDPSVAAPLIVMLHGAGGRSIHAIELLQGYADETGTILLAPDSRARTWDMIESKYGPDVEFIEKSLYRLFSSYHIDSSRIGLAGFSDGASYALSLGLINGDLFTHLIALSPGFMLPTVFMDSPTIFISHGVDDTVLPIDRCSRKIVEQLRAAQLSVKYKEFPGGHTIVDSILNDAVNWFVGKRKPHDLFAAVFRDSEAPL